jgi:hypothetical protein
MAKSLLTPRIQRVPGLRPAFLVQADVRADHHRNVRDDRAGDDGHASYKAIGLSCYENAWRCFTNSAQRWRSLATRARRSWWVLTPLGRRTVGIESSSFVTLTAVMVLEPAASARFRSLSRGNFIKLSRNGGEFGMNYGIAQRREVRCTPCRSSDWQPPTVADRQLPEPTAQRNLRPLKNGPRRQRNLVPTLGALVAPLLLQFVGSFVPASRANEPHLANDKPPEASGWPPRWQNRTETGEASWETQVAAPPYTTYRAC